MSTGEKEFVSFPPGGQRAKREITMKKEYDFSKGKRGGVVEQRGKTRITIYLDNYVLEEFRSRADAAGSGYQTMINDVLREYLKERIERPLSERTLRKVVREELKRVAGES